MVVLGSAMVSSLSLGTITIESTNCFRNLIPISACSDLLRPSNEKGLVTTPTVKIPISFAIFATIGAAPVPVPPPIPAVTNTISAPDSNLDISSTFSSADFCPTSGFPPAPSPLVNFSPICSLLSALLISRSCLSVFKAMKFTFLNSASIILLTALQPPPPTPTTRILAFPLLSTSNSKKDPLIKFSSILYGT